MNMYLRAKAKGVNSLEQNICNILSAMISDNWGKSELFRFELPLLGILWGASNVVRSNSQKRISIEGCP